MKKNLFKLVVHFILWMFGIGTAAFLVSACAMAAPTLAADLTVQRTMIVQGKTSPSQITSNTNDYAPTGFSTSTRLRLTTDASRNLTGMAGGADGLIKTIHNTGTHDLVLVNESSGSTAANRFAIGADTTISGGYSFTVIYDSTSNRWRSWGGGGSGGGGAWGGITGTLSAQTDLQAALDAKQGLHANLTALSGLTGAADRVTYFTGAGAMSLATFTSAGRTLVAGATAAAQRATLSLDNVENTALSTWAGTTNITTVGTVSVGVWNGTIVTSGYGGTGNGFTKFTGATSSEKTYTLPNASATVLTDNAAVTVAQGGTGRQTGTTAYALVATGTTATGAQQTLGVGATTDILVGGGSSALPVWTTATGTGAPVRAGSPTFTGTVITAASATGGAGFRLSPGVAPTSPTNGDLWLTSAALQARIGGSTVTFGAGDVVGPSSATDTAIAVFDTTTGKLLKNTVVLIDSSGNLTGVGNITATGGLAVTGGINDTNNNELFIFTATASAVNEVTFANAATGNNPKWSATGGDTNIGLDWQVKGTGVYRLLATASGPTDLRLFEDTDNGTNYASLIAPASMTSNRVLTLPDATDTLMGKATTDTLTNKTFDTAGTGNSFSINGVAATTNTGTGAVARAAAPTFTTPTLGVATATSVNKWTFTAPTTAATLTAGGDNLTYTMPSSSTTMVGRDTTDTLTNKTLTSPSMSGVTISDLTATYIPYAGTGGLLTTDSAFRYASSVLNVPGIAVSGGVTALGGLDTGGGLGTNNTFLGLTVGSFQAGAALTQWQVVYTDTSSTIQVYQADADGSGTYPAIGIVTTAVSSGGSARWITQGCVRNNSWSWTPGGKIYLSTTAGGLTQTQPTGDAYVQVVGVAMTSAIAYFDFGSPQQSLGYATHLGTFSSPDTTAGNITWTAPVYDVSTSASGATRTYTLPAAASYTGRACILSVVVGTNHVNVQPASGAQLVLNGVLLTANHYVQATTSAAGNYICFRSDGVNWRSLGSSGTWADAASP